MIQLLKRHDIALLCLVFLLGCCTETTAQYNNHLWFFGRGSTGVSFSMINNAPQPHTLHSELNQEGSCVVVNPYNKQLLFYSDGDKVYNRNHRVMPSGIGLGGCPSSAQAAVAIPKPGTDRQYYLFSNAYGSACTSNALRLATIDMELDDGLGDLAPNSSSIVLDKVAEGMTAVPEPNSPNYWIIGNMKNGTHSHYIIHVTAAGINPPIFYDYAPSFASFNLNYHPSRNCISSIYRNDGLQEIRLFDFNTETGELAASTISIPLNTPHAYDVEISPDGSKLYYSSWKKIELFQYDLTTNQVHQLYNASIHEDSRGGGLATGPDGKIYHIYESDSTSLAVIQNPDLVGSDCNYVPEGLELYSPIRTLNFPFNTPYASSEEPLSGVINTYGCVTDWCGNSLEVDQAEQFSVGDTVLIIQMQGAAIDTSNTADFGTILNYGSAGLHELNIITDIQSETIVLGRPLQHNYDVNGRIQIVDRPYLGNTIVGGLTCLPWNGKTGGVLAFSADQLELADHIDVSGRGFRGGQAQSDPPMPNTAPFPIRTSYVFPADSIDASGKKGEGIAVLTSQIKRGKGSSQGGGGGNDHNAGGGGGANAGEGGMGGVWYGQDSVHMGANGLGGRAIDNNSVSYRLFLGGGGGAGHTNNYWSTSGGNGGGIVIVSANHITHNGSRIKANGASVGMDYSGIFNDGGGGGGAGGSIVLLLPANNQNDIVLESYGGFGGTSDQHGHGGGGGGGIVYMNAYTNGGLLINVQGGLPGNDGHFNEAQRGENGRFDTGYELPFGDVPFEPLAIDNIHIHPECDSSSSVLVKASGTNLCINFNNQTWSKDSLFLNLESGLYNIRVTNGCDTLSDQIQVDNIPPLAGSFENIANPICDSLGIVQYVAFNGLPPYTYSLENTAISQSYGTFQSLPQGKYRIEVKDQRGCLLTDSFTLEREVYELDIAMPVRTTIQRYDTIKSLPFSITPNTPPFQYQWRGERGIHCLDCESPELYPQASTTYYLNVTDYWGCTGSDSIRIIVEEPKMYVPNAFSPNGDGINDLFTFYAGPSMLGPTKFQVFDRWGNMLFQGSEGNWAWDGYVNGYLSQTGVYTYVLHWLDKGNEQHTLTGNVKLL